LQRFLNEDSTDVLFTVFSTGGQGLNLTRANHAIMCEPGYTYVEYSQAVGRIYRLGQEKECHVHELLIHQSIEIWKTSISTRKFEMQSHWREDPVVKVEGDYSSSNTSILKSILMNGKKYGYEHDPKEMEEIQRALLKVRLQTRFLDGSGFVEPDDGENSKPYFPTSGKFHGYDDLQMEEAYNSSDDDKPLKQILKKQKLT
jgi:superfamily II DNA or RNA helicase